MTILHIFRKIPLWKIVLGCLGLCLVFLPMVIKNFKPQMEIGGEIKVPPVIELEPIPDETEEPFETMLERIPVGWQINGALAALDDTIPEVQVEALEKLNELKALDMIPEEQIPKIVTLLKDENPNVRRVAIESLGNLDAKEYLSQVMTCLEDQDENVRSAANTTLVKLNEGVQEYIPQIADLLENEDPNVRASVVRTFGRLSEGEIGGYFDQQGVWIPYRVEVSEDLRSTINEIIPQIVALLADEDKNVRFAVSEALGKINGAKVFIPQIQTFLKYENPDIRYAAINALGYFITEEGMIEEISKFYNDNEPNVRVVVANVLDIFYRFYGYSDEVRIEPSDSINEALKDSISKIITLLGDNDINVSNAAALALRSNMGVEKESISRIVELFQAPKSHVRANAVYVLGTIGGDSVREYVPQIILLLRDEDTNVRYSAASALGNLGELIREYVPQLVALLKDKDENVRSVGIYALSNFGDVLKDSLQQIHELLNDHDLNVHFAAATVIVSLSVQKNITTTGRIWRTPTQQTITFLKHEDMFIRSITVTELINLGIAVEQYIPQILALLSHEGPLIRSSAISVANSILMNQKAKVGKESFSKILSLLRHEDWYVRSIAFKALWKLEGVEDASFSQLLSLFEHDNQNIRSAAARILGNLNKIPESYIPQIALLLEDKDQDVRVAAVKALGNFGEVAKDYIPQILEILAPIEYTSKPLTSYRDPQDPWSVQQIPPLDEVNWNSRSHVVTALGKLKAKEFISHILLLLYDSDFDVRQTAIETLSELNEVGLELIPVIINPIYEDISRSVELRFLAHLVGAGKKDVEIFLRWLGKPGNYPSTLTYKEAKETLKVFEVVWEISQIKGFEELRKDLAERIAIVVSQCNVKWKWDDISLLQRHLKHLETMGATQANTVKQVISSMKTRIWISRIVIILLIHAVCWLALIIMYPISSQIQKISFWNPYVRYIGGLMYIHFVLLLIPYFKRRLFEPLREALLSDAALDTFDEALYFEGSEVKRKGSQEVIPIHTAIPEIEGQIILEGDSGLGKTMFIRYLLNHSTRPIMYLPAEKCSKGIMEAIQVKLHDVVNDTNFLRRLIYNGAIDICVDGLNEVSAETRANVALFAERYFKGNILMITQPIGWIPPVAAKTYVLQPLKHRQIEEFLLSRSVLPTPTISHEKIFQQICRTYLAKALNPEQPWEILNAAQRVLTNPMDLTIVVQLLAHGKEPNLFHLQEQQYRLMVQYYTQRHDGRCFPLADFAERVYQMRLNDEFVLPKDEFDDEIIYMKYYKMVYSRLSSKLMSEYYFWHDKIMEFFIAQTFVHDKDRIAQHISDPRFRGVYFLLTEMLPLEESIALREELVQYSANTHDHLVSDTYVQLIRNRQLRQLEEGEEAKEKPVLPISTKVETREWNYIRNPYLPGKPDPELHEVERLFVGREDVMQFIDENLVAAAIERIIVLYGHRRTGKTWVLLRLQERFPNIYLPVYIDVQGFTSVTGIPAVLQNLADKILNAIEEVHTDARSVIRVPTFEEYEKNHSHYFEEVFLRDVQDLLSGCKLLWLFDEFQGLGDMVAAGNLPTTFMEFLRHLMQFGKKMAFIFAGTREMTEQYWSVFFNIAVHRKIGVLNGSDATELIENPVKDYGVLYNRSAVSLIKQLTGNHAYFIQLLCDGIVSQLNTQQQMLVDTQIVNTAVENLVIQGVSNLKFYWAEIMDERERAVAGTIQELLRRRKPADVSTTWSEMSEYSSRVTQEEVLVILKSLAEKDLLEKDNVALNAYKFRIGLIDRYIDTHVPYLETQGRIAKLW